MNPFGNHFRGRKNLSAGKRPNLGDKGEGGGGRTSIKGRKLFSIFCAPY